MLHKFVESTQSSSSFWLRSSRSIKARESMLREIAYQRDCSSECAQLQDHYKSITIRVIQYFLLIYHIAKVLWSYLHIILAIFEIMFVRFIMFERNIISRDKEVCHFLVYFLFPTLMIVEWTLIIFKGSVTWQLLWSPLRCGTQPSFFSVWINFQDLC